MCDSNLKISLCRTCLATLLHSEFYNVFNTLDLANKLTLCSGQQVETTDEYPENVCLQCYEQIMLFYDFQQMCLKSLDTFYKLLNTKQPVRDESVNKITQIEYQTKDPLSNPLTEKPIKSTDKKQIFNKVLEKKNRDRPVKTKLDKRKTVIERSKKTELRKDVDGGDFEAAVQDDLGDYLHFDTETKEYLEIETISSNKDSLDEQAYKNFIINETEVPDLKDESCYNTQQGEEKEKLLTDTESCSSVKDFISIKSQSHQCERCSKIFKSVLRFQAHIRKHDGLPAYICTFEGCECSFDRWHFYNKHQKQHNLVHEQSFKCDVDNCERVYKNKSNLNIHKRKFHHFGPQLKTHMCEICGKVFKSSAVLNDHQYTHIDKTQLPYACEEEGCCKRFSNKEKLRIHKMRHAGIKNFICPYCGMRKTTRNELKIHINYHTLERTWSCRFCPKVCNSAGNLKMHVKNMHERAKDYACRYCERTFAKADTKKYHEMIHTGEKPHECKECGRRFVQPAALRTHRKIHLRQKGNLSEDPKSEKTIVTDKMRSIVENVDENDVLTQSTDGGDLSNTYEK